MCMQYIGTHITVRLFHFSSLKLRTPKSPPDSKLIFFPNCLSPFAFSSLYILLLIFFFFSPIFFHKQILEQQSLFPLPASLNLQNTPNWFLWQRISRFSHLPISAKQLCLLKRSGFCFVFLKLGCFFFCHSHLFPAAWRQQCWNKLWPFCAA